VWWDGVFYATWFRNIVGTLVEVGHGERPSTISRGCSKPVIDSRPSDRPPHGLYLVPPSTTTEDMPNAERLADCVLRRLSVEQKREYDRSDARKTLPLARARTLSEATDAVVTALGSDLRCG